MHDEMNDYSTRMNLAGRCPPLGQSKYGNPASENSGRAEKSPSTRINWRHSSVRAMPGFAWSFRRRRLRTAVRVRLSM